MKKNENLPLCEKYVLTVDEACSYFSIGRDKMYEMAKAPGAPYVLRNGRTILIKRAAMEKYIEQMFFI